MPIRCLPRLGVLMLLPLVTGACGLIFVKGPPQNHQQLSYFNCTEGNLGPVLDVVGSGLSVIGAIAAATNDTLSSKGAIVGTNIGFAVLFGFSANSGFKKTKKCRAAKGAWLLRQEQSSAITEPWQIEIQPTTIVPDALLISVPRFPVRMTYDTTAVTATE